MSEINPTARAVDVSAYKTLEQMQMKPSADGAPPVTISDTFEGSKHNPSTTMTPLPSFTNVTTSVPGIQLKEHHLSLIHI